MMMRHQDEKKLNYSKNVLFQIRDVLDPAEMVQNCVNWCNNNSTSDGDIAACGFFNFQVNL